MNAAQLLQRIGEDQVAGFFLVLARLAPLFIVAPLFSSKMIPTRARVVVALALAVGITPLVVGHSRISMEPGTYTELVAKELLVGLTFAFAIGALFWAVQAAGALIDTLAGFSFGALVDPITGTQSSIISQAYGLIAVLIFIAIGGDAWVIEGIVRTYELVPLDAFPHLGSLVELVLKAFAAISVAAIEVSAPILLALVLTDTAFGLVSRVVPQLNFFAVGFPVKVVVTLALIGVSLPFMAGWISGELQRSVSTALQAIGT